MQWLPRPMDTQRAGSGRNPERFALRGWARSVVSVTIWAAREDLIPAASEGDEFGLLAENLATATKPQINLANELADSCADSYPGRTAACSTEGTYQQPIPTGIKCSLRRRITVRSATAALERSGRASELDGICWRTASGRFRFGTSRLDRVNTLRYCCQE